MSHGAPQPINFITVSQGGAPVVALTITGMHQDHQPPRPSVGNHVTHWHGSTNAFQTTIPGVLAVSPNVTVTRGTSTTHMQGPHPPQFVQASGHTYSAPRTTPQPTVSVASGRSAPPAFSPPQTTAPSAYPPSHRPRPHPRQPPTALSNPSYRGSSSDNQDRTDSRGFHYAEGTNGRPQAGRVRDSVDPRVAPRAPPVDADRRGRHLVGAEYVAGGGPIPRKYLDAAWGVTPSTKNALGLTD